MVDNETVLKLQSVQKDILLELDRVCRELNLEYCMAFGSCLGAIRHRGFIPWDDDIDVYMNFEELEILQQHADLFSDKYFLQCRKTDPEFGLMISRIRDCDTTLIEQTETDRDINHGVFIDIYPLFNSPEKGWKADKLVFASMIYRLLLYQRVPQNRGKLMKIGSAILLKLLPKGLQKRWIRKSYDYMRRQKDTGYISSLYGDEARIRYPKEWMFPVKRVDFEDIQVPVPNNAHMYLKYTFGDYMQLPPEDKRQIHHDFACIDFEHSYTRYKGTLYCKED